MAGMTMSAELNRELLHTLKQVRSSREAVQITYVLQFKLKYKNQTKGT